MLEIGNTNVSNAKTTIEVVEDKRVVFELHFNHQNERAVVEVRTLIEKIFSNMAVPTYYTENEIKDFLIRKKYSEEIAEDLAGYWSRDLQGAFNKGFAIALGNPGDYKQHLRTAISHIETLTSQGQTSETQRVLSWLKQAYERIQLRRNEKPGAMELLREMNTYLSGNGGNYIGNGSKLHQKIKEALKP